MPTNEEIKVVIRAENKTDGAFNGVGANLEKVKSIAGGLAKAVGTTFVAAFAAAGAAATAFAKGSFDAYVESEKEMAVANQALKNSLGDLTENSMRKLKEQLGGTANVMSGLQRQMDEVARGAVKLAFDDEAASVAFAKLFQSTKDVKQAQDDVALAMDLAAYSGRSLEESTKTILSVHAGGTRILKEFGIAVEEGTSIEEALDLTHKKVAGSAEAMAKTTDGQLKVLSTSWGNLKEDVGRALAEAVTPFIKKLTDWVNSDETQEKIKKITDSIKEFSDKLNEAGGIVNLIKDSVFTPFFNFIEEKTGVITILKTAWDDIVLVFRENLLPELMKLWDALQPLKPFMETFAKIIGVILYGAFIALVKLLEVSVIATIHLLTGAVQKATDWVNKFKSGWDAVTDALAKVISYIDSVIEKMKNLNVIQNAKNFISDKLGFGGGKAEGGFVSSNKAYVVGEQGPELFLPGMNGTIIPNNRLAMAGSNITINVTGNTFLDDDAAEKFGDRLIRILKQEIRI